MLITVCRVYGAKDDMGRRKEYADFAVDDLYDDVSISLLDANGIRVSFDGDARHVPSWANEHGFAVETHAIELDISNSRVTKWVTSFDKACGE